jgi:hypothetical protein
MSRKKNILSRKDERGVVITLVAIFMLFVVGAMAALSIDVVTIYTARSEAQLAADGAALAAARVIANSGATSDSTGTVLTSVEAAGGPAQNVAAQVAEQNQVGGTYLTSANILTPSFAGTYTNPTVTVKIQVTTLPTFFARIWGTKFITVAAAATAEAYNPSGVAGTTSTTKFPVAPMCVKPWLLPNMSPAAGGPIFNAATGAIVDTTLLGWETPTIGGTRLRTDCTANCGVPPAPTPWYYYPGTTDATTGSFPAPGATSCTGCAAFTPYQLSVAGCVQTPISCNEQVNVDTNAYPNRDPETGTAVKNLTHTTTGPGGDSVDTTAPSPPFQFLAGDDNPIVLSGALGAKTTPIMVSDSLVTVPVINLDNTTILPPVGYPTVQIIGFVQLFLSPTGQPAPASGHIHTQVINMVGCGTGATGTPTILGNGASPVAVRLISPP